MKQPLLYGIVFSLLMPQCVDANEQNQNDQAKLNQAIKTEQQTLQKALLNKQSLEELNVSRKDDYTRFTGKYLVEHPEILEKILVESLINTNKQVLPTLIALYKRVPNRDESLLEWGNAILLTDTNLNDSVSEYRKLLANFPDNNFIRFQLARVLFFNQEFDASKNQFEKLRAADNVSAQDREVFNQFISAIDEKSQWTYSFGITYLNDKNLSNSAKEGTIVVLPNGQTAVYNTPRQKGNGVGISLGANKQWALSGGKYIVLNTGMNTKYYWNNKNYNDLTGVFGLGLGYSDARFNIEVQPYVNKRWYSGGVNGSESLKQYYDTYGVSLSTSYWLNQSFKYSFYYDYGYEKYKQENYATQYQGGTHLISNSLMYVPSPTQYWALSLDLMTKNARDKSNSFLREGARLSWGQEWPLGISTNTSFGIAKRNYKEASFLGKQKNNEYNASISIWNKKIHYAGFTTRLTWIYTKTNSNISLYTYDKNQMVIEATRTF